MIYNVASISAAPNIHSRFLLVICFVSGSAYVSIPISYSIPPPAELQVLKHGVSAETFESQRPLAGAGRAGAAMRCSQPGLRLVVPLWGNIGNLSASGSPL